MVENSSYVVGGQGNTPLTYTKLDKRMLIDYLSATFDKIEYKTLGNGQFTIHENSYDDLNELLTILKSNKDWSKYDEEYARNNYRKAIVVGEFIRLQFNGPKNSKGNRTTMIEFTGDACREFEERGGSWLELKLLLIKWGAYFTRCDPAIDCFTGKECTPYQIQRHVERYEYTSSFKTHTIMQSGDRSTETFIGYTIYIGAGGKSVELLINIWSNFKLFSSKISTNTAFSIPNCKL